MKRLLLICGTALMLVPAAFAAKPSQAPLTLTPSCSPCPAGQPVSFTGSGLSDSRTYKITLTTDDGYVRWQTLPQSQGGQVAFTMVYFPDTATVGHFLLQSKAGFRSSNYTNDLAFDIAFE